MFCCHSDSHRHGHTNAQTSAEQWPGEAPPSTCTSSCWASSVLGEEGRVGVFLLSFSLPPSLPPPLLVSGSPSVPVLRHPPICPPQCSVFPETASSGGQGRSDRPLLHPQHRAGAWQACRAQSLDGRFPSRTCSLRRVWRPAPETPRLGSHVVEPSNPLYS